MECILFYGKREAGSVRYLRGVVPSALCRLIVSSDLERTFDFDRSSELRCLMSQRIHSLQRHVLLVTAKR